MEHPNCPNCGEKIKSGFLSSNELTSPELTTYINEFQSDKKAAYCEDCWPSLKYDTDTRYREEIKKYQSMVLSVIDTIPVLSIQAPQNWETTPLEIVSGRASGYLDSILDDGKPRPQDGSLAADQLDCARLLRGRALRAGGNAVVGVTFSYTAVPTTELSINTNNTYISTVLVTTATGTAVEVANTSVLGEQWEQAMKTMTIARERLDHLYSIKPDHIDDIDLL